MAMFGVRIVVGLLKTNKGVRGMNYMGGNNEMNEIEEMMSHQTGDLIDVFYDKLWNLHESAALTASADKVAVAILNAIDNALGR